MARNRIFSCFDWSGREGKPFQSQENGKKRGPFATENLVVLQFVQLIRYQKTHKVCEDG